MTISALTFTVPLVSIFHKAERLWLAQLNPQKQKQVQLNLLATYAVSYYLQCLGVATDLTASPSWEQVAHSLLDNAALKVPGIGHLECRPFLKGAEQVYIPPESWDDRRGFLAIEIDLEQKRGTIVGFLPQAPSEQVALNEWHSLDDFLDILEPAEELEAESLPLVTLSNWLHNVVEQGWQELHEILRPQELAIGFRDGNRSRKPEIQTPEDLEMTKRAKLVDLYGALAHDPIILLIGLQPISAEQIDIWVKLRPVDYPANLPAGLRVSLITPEGDSIADVKTTENEFLRFNFTAEIGERFNIQIQWHDQTIVETFQI